MYDAAGGREGMLRLAEAWHRRVLADEVVAHAFSHGFKDDHTPRLAAYFEEALGGPATYTETYGDESGVVWIHSGDGEHTDMDNRAVRCWDEALTDLGSMPTSGSEARCTTTSRGRPGRRCRATTSQPTRSPTD